MDPSIYRRNAEIEERHWWFVGRRRIVERMIERLLGKATSGPGLRLLEVGCGSGGNSPTFACFGELIAVEPEPYAAGIARGRGVGEVLVDGLPALTTMEGRCFDLILLCDVLEHVDEEAESLERLYALLRPGGTILITVPAFPSLWGGHDELHHHRRRYRRPQLVRRLEQAGFRPLYAGYFNSLLFLPAAAIRLVDRGRSRPGARGLGLPPPFVNGLLSWMFALERHWLGRVAPPFGLSLLAVADREGQ